MTNPATILIVEDNPYNLHIAKELLEMAGYQTLAAEDADTGIQLARERNPDLILMDMYLPTKDGYEATRLLKTNPETRHIPVIAFTALAMHEDRKRAETAGCIGIISKPIVVDTFAHTVISYLDSKTLPPEIQPSSDNAYSELDPEFRKLYLALSHDMQAPIRKIQQFCGFVKSTDAQTMSLESMKFLEGIERSAQQMQDVLERFLNTTLAGKK